MMHPSSRPSHFLLLAFFLVILLPDLTQAAAFIKTNAALMQKHKCAPTPVVSAPPRMPARRFSLTTSLMAERPRSTTSPFSSFFPSSSKTASLTNKKRDGGQAVSQVKKYFEYWNMRQMQNAVDLFTEDCEYEDTLYSGSFAGKEALKKHLFRCADALPDSFAFVVDEISEGGNNVVGLKWHVESNGKPLPFTRGCSVYTIDEMSGLIKSGFDVPEPTIKSGSFSLAILNVVGKLLDSPIKAVPLAGFLFYCWFVFLSTVAPGPNALSLDPATWAEVRDLSLNFWLIVPLLSPESAPVLHPVLEGVFNGLLAWAALFSGFMIDGMAAPSPLQTTGQQVEEDGEENEKKKNAFLPYVLGMQLLTNAIYLPYLVARKPFTSSSAPQCYEGSLTKAEAFGESKLPPIVFAGVGLLSIWWALVAREDAFGDLSQRFASFVDIASTDRLTFSFLVDLVYFWAFQGWLMGDDLKRRQVPQGAVEEKKGPSLALAKAVPFFGLVYYLLARPPLPGREGGKK